MKNIKKFICMIILMMIGMINSSIEATWQITNNLGASVSLQPQGQSSFSIVSNGVYHPTPTTPSLSNISICSGNYSCVSKNLSLDYAYTLIIQNNTITVQYTDTAGTVHTL